MDEDSKRQGHITDTMHADVFPGRRLTGTTGIAVLSAIHVALVASMFWVLLANGLVATQIVEWVSRLYLLWA